MTLILKEGTVTSQADITRTGMFSVAFDLSDEKSQPQQVHYVTPYGNTEAAFVAIPIAGSKILCIEDDSVGGVNGIYYLGSVMGSITGLNEALPIPPEHRPPPPPKYIPKVKPGTFGPDLLEYESAIMTGGNTPSWPDAFKDMYDGKEIIPEALGLTNYRGDTFKISSRYTSSQKEWLGTPFQDLRIGMNSGSGKKIELVDSPIVDGIVMSNEHKGKDFFIWSSGGSKDSPFSEGEYHMRTHGPVNLYTLVNNFHIWVEDGLNIEIENKSTPSKSYGPGINVDPTMDGSSIPIGGMKNQGTSTGDYSSRKGQYGNETTGCIQLKSWYNNISLQAEALDSVVYIEAPGNEAKVIVDCGGSVDIVSQGKATIQSNTEVEVNAPLVDINGSTNVEINGGTKVNITGGESIDLDATNINLTGIVHIKGTLTIFDILKKTTINVYNYLTGHKHGFQGDALHKGTTEVPFLP